MHADDQFAAAVPGENRRLDRSETGDFNRSVAPGHHTRRTEPGQALVRGDQPDIFCNTLVGHLADDFLGEERVGYCTRLSAEIAACVAETLKKTGVVYVIDARLPIPPD